MAMTSKKQSRRFSVTLSEAGYETLKEMAGEEGAETASLAAFFLQREVSQYRERNLKSINQLINFIRGLLGKEDCDPPSISVVEKIVGVSGEELSRLSLALENLEMLKGAVKSLIKSGDFDGYSIAELSEFLGCNPSDLDGFVDGLSRDKSKENKRAET